MATQSSVLAWRILGTREPCGLLSMGSHRVRHNEVTQQQQQQQVALVNLTMSSFTQISLKMCLKQTVKFITLITRYYFQELPKAKISLYKNKMKSFKKEITFLHFFNGFNIIRLINIQVKVHKKMINLTSSERLSILYKLG